MSNIPQRPVSQVQSPYDTRDLVQRAIKVGYKDRLPKMPKSPNSSTMIGYRKRTSNWMHKLMHFERERINQVNS